MKASRGARAHLVHARHAGEPLPEPAARVRRRAGRQARDAALRAVADRRVPRRAAGRARARPSVAPGFETFLYALDGEASLLVDGRELAARAPARFAYLPGDRRRSSCSRASAPARLLLVKRRYEPTPGHDAPGLLAGHRDDEPFADTPVPGFRRRELLPVGDPAFDFA